MSFFISAPVSQLHPKWHTAQLSGFTPHMTWRCAAVPRLKPNETCLVAFIGLSLSLDRTIMWLLYSDFKLWNWQAHELHPREITAHREMRLLWQETFNWTFTDVKLVAKVCSKDGCWNMYTYCKRWSLSNIICLGQVHFLNMWTGSRQCIKQIISSLNRASNHVNFPLFTLACAVCCIMELTV